MQERRVQFSQDIEITQELLFGEDAATDSKPDPAALENKQKALEDNNAGSKQVEALT
jgi:hypothetical protein